MTYTQILQWIKNNLSPAIQQAIAAKPGIIYTEDWLAAITCRETGALIARYAIVQPTMALADIASLMKGDYTQRPADTEKTYHGFGFTQIDIASFPDWVKSGAWKVPANCYAQSIAILESSRAYLQHHYPDLAGVDLQRAITAAYNCGAGNVNIVLSEGHDIDIRTTGKNYSEQVFQFREIYKEVS